MTTTIQKARPQPYRRLHATADRFVSRFTGPYMNSVMRARGRVTDADVERSLAVGAPVGSLVDVFAEILVAKQVDPAAAGRQVYQELISASVLDMVEYVERDMGLPAARIAGTFDVTNPHVLRAAETLTADLIRGVSDESKAAVRRIITDSVRDGVPPRDAARTIRQIVGLTERQALQVANYRRGLSDLGRKPDDVDRLSDRLSGRLLRHRAENIARTETLRASNRGQQIMWQEMVNQGVLGAEFRQRWLVTPDDRLCSRCAPMQGKTVQLGYLFRETESGVLPSSRVPVAGGTTESPPLHPRCRCVLVADVGEPAAAPARPSQPVAPPTAQPKPAPPAGDHLTAEQRTALAPAKRYNAKLRGETEAGLRSTEQGGHLADAINDFQHEKGGVKSLRAGITKERAVRGSGGPKAQAMVDAIRNAPVEDQVMWRGMRVQKSAKGLLEEYADGTLIDMNLSSFSTSAGVAQTFAGGAGSGGTEVIIGVIGKHKAIPIQNLAKTSSFFSEKELITGGRFKVVGAEKQGSQVVITLQQIGLL